MRRRWMAAVAAGTLIAAGASAATYAIQDHRVTTAQAEASQSQQIAQVLAAADARIVVGDIDGGQVVVISSATLAKSVVSVTHLPPPGPMAYQLWMAFGGAPRSIGVLPAGADSTIRLVPDTTGATSLTISKEPAGGSATQTIVVGSLSTI